MNIIVQENFIEEFMKVAKHNLSVDDNLHIETLAYLLGYESEGNLIATELIFPKQEGSSVMVVDQGKLLGCLCWCIWVLGMLKVAFCTALCRVTFIMSQIYLCHTEGSLKLSLIALRLIVSLITKPIPYLTRELKLLILVLKIKRISAD